jgi:hypothetical protein
VLSGTKDVVPMSNSRCNRAACVADVLMPISFLMDLFQYWAIQWRYKLDPWFQKNAKKLELIKYIDSEPSFLKPFKSIVSWPGFCVSLMTVGVSDNLVNVSFWSFSAVCLTFTVKAQAIEENKN